MADNYVRGEKHPSAKLRAADVLAIRVAPGRQIDIAGRYRVNARVGQPDQAPQNLEEPRRSAGRAVIHYHGGPITPDTCAIRAWKARHAFVSFAAAQQIALAASITQSFALDNGAFTFWKRHRPTDWPAYYTWVAQWSRMPAFDFAVVPDVIEGSEVENDALLAEWPFSKHVGAPVWHTNESIDRLVRLVHEWPRVCIGSSGAFDVSKVDAFLARMAEIMPHVTDAEGHPFAKLHGLRMLNPKIFSRLPLASADSTNVAINIGKDVAWRGTYQPQSKELRAAVLVERIEHYNATTRFERPVDMFA